MGIFRIDPPLLISTDPLLGKKKLEALEIVPTDGARLDLIHLKNPMRVSFFFE
jgi:hypothetical protein